MGFQLTNRPMLIVAVFLFLMGLKFVGEGFQELQEQALVPYHLMPKSDTLMQIGLNPTWEAVGAQVAILAASIIVALWMRVSARAQTAGAN